MVDTPMLVQRENKSMNEKIPLLYFLFSFHYPTPLFNRKTEGPHLVITNTGWVLGTERLWLDTHKVRWFIVWKKVQAQKWLFYHRRWLTAVECGGEGAVGVLGTNGSLWLRMGALGSDRMVYGELFSLVPSWPFQHRLIFGPEAIVSRCWLGL